MGWRAVVVGGARLASPVLQEPMVIEGDGPMPILMHWDSTPIVVPPGPVEPPPTGLPFDWPSQPTIVGEDPAARYTGLGQGFYAAQHEFQNPLPASNMCAGNLAPDLHFGTIFIGSQRLWAPRDADGDTIRRVLAIGRP